jgi:hypothetical protein
VEVPVFVCLRTTCNHVTEEGLKVCETRTEGCHAKWRGLCGCNPATPTACEAVCAPQPVWIFRREKSRLLCTCTFETAILVKRHLVHPTPDNHQICVFLQSLQKHYEIGTSRTKTEKYQTWNPWQHPPADGSSCSSCSLGKPWRSVEHSNDYCQIPVVHWLRTTIIGT